MFEISYSFDAAPSIREKLSERKKRGKPMVIDPAKNMDFIREAIVLGIAQQEDQPAQKDEVAMAAGEGAKATRISGTGLAAPSGQVVALGPQVGIIPCVEVPIGFIFHCGDVTIGGCS
jgi:hypothetical protein